MINVCFDRFSSKGRKFATIYSTESLISIIKTKQGRKDKAGCFGIYSYNISMRSNDLQRLKENLNIKMYEGDANEFIKEFGNITLVL